MRVIAATEKEKTKKSIATKKSASIPLNVENIVIAMAKRRGAQRGHRSVLWLRIKLQ